MARITVEDCLVKENNRFALVLLAARRTKQILGGSKALVDSKGNKSVVTALREIADGQVTFMTEDEILEQQEREALEALEEKSKAEASSLAQQALAAATTNGSGVNGNGVHASAQPAATELAPELLAPKVSDSDDDSDEVVAKTAPQAFVAKTSHIYLFVREVNLCYSVR